MLPPKTYIMCIRYVLECLGGGGTIHIYIYNVAMENHHFG